MKPVAAFPLRHVVVIGVASGIGAPDAATADGPGALRRYRVFRPSPSQPVEWDGMLRVPAALRHAPLQAVSTLASQIADEVESVVQAGNFPLVVGGDHSCAIGTWSGVRRTLIKQGSLGLIWIDAHMDSHTFATTPSGQIHGMPLACLLGQGDATLTTLAGPAPVLTPHQVCLIGVRSFEAGEAALLQEMGVRVFAMTEIRQRGLPAVFDDALALVKHGTAGFGVSVDLDALDPDEEPGVTCPTPDGLRLAELTEALSHLRNDPAFIAMEIAEYNPRQDRNRITAHAAGALLDTIAPLGPTPD